MVEPGTSSGFDYDPTTYEQIYSGIVYEGQRPWNFLNVLKANIPPGSKILDCGCGPISTPKLQAIAPQAARIVAFDSSYKKRILESARANLAKQDIVDKTDLLYADISPAEGGFPFRDETFDAVTFMLAPHNALETYRVLRPGGVVILERVGEKDKRNIKAEFGMGIDRKPRGYLMEHQPGDLSRIYEEDFRNAGFSDVQVTDGLWDTFYTSEGLLKIIQGARTVRDFDSVKDTEILRTIQEKFGDAEKAIHTFQHRILLIARKPLA
ncbi:hypothetical protein A3D00_03790 [Candidatus Woesebacteria bacterium RIFCSPHIGHO2_02_FULL_38_9]|uniref:Methyltransferase domain-containing protein n=1 Tax=Candidatus Woesebacteria bacterium RIFCSPHIGHO2_01_FULL_39_28 TaxID=1802496 RepID=A0A1F7YCE5_9BACT|nr:MAG: hypothetical protein A2627_05005 [Candidatus Woesebacteria bacterium RIFCSPHIGHO2_01_FULL_39_28]OGM33953.1 MAG: hypothetical protein A3D00_03790 [Candidatus Woesebacteria bacterium RIFCSPHIGHO2_02_FULL_38_9]OGM57552.1 MAG: hypothetical protein A3A50_06120 [Candidatus Woesebacteria bacterium RIFCSPLOWO2_01_FULL_38_20]